MYADFALSVNGKFRMTPPEKATISADTFLHVTMEVSSFTTARRYPQIIISDQHVPVQHNLALGNALLIHPYGDWPNLFEVQVCDHRDWDVNLHCSYADRPAAVLPIHARAFAARRAAPLRQPWLQERRGGAGVGRGPLALHLGAADAPLTRFREGRYWARVEPLSPLGLTLTGLCFLPAGCGSGGSAGDAPQGEAGGGTGGGEAGSRSAMAGMGGGMAAAGQPPSGGSPGGGSAGAATGETWTELEVGGATCIFGDGKHLYSAPAWGMNPFFISEESDGLTWTAQPGDQVFDNGGSYEMVMDRVNGILYASMWEQGVWAMKVAP
jgi:hypothetical protein